VIETDVEGMEEQEAEITEGGLVLRVVRRGLGDVEFEEEEDGCEGGTTEGNVMMTGAEGIDRGMRRVVVVPGEDRGVGWRGWFA